MKVELVSVNTKHNLDEEIIAEIINSSTADIIIFGGGTLKNYQSLRNLSRLIFNDKTTCLIDLHTDIHSEHTCYIIQKGKTIDLLTKRRYWAEKDFESDLIFAEGFMREMEERRQITFDQQNILLFIGSDYRMFTKETGQDELSFCWEDFPQIEKRWKELYHKSTMICNLSFSKPMNKIKVKKLLSHSKPYVSVSNAPKLNKRLNYILLGGKELEPLCYFISENELYAYWIYEV